MNSSIYKITSATLLDGVTPQALAKHRVGTLRVIGLLEVGSGGELFHADKTELCLTSTVRKIERTEKTVKITTRNTVYTLEEVEK